MSEQPDAAAADTGAPDGGGVRGGRGLAIAISLLAVGSFLLLIALSKAWTVAPAALLDGVTPSRERAVSGATVAPAATAAAWIGFAGIAGLIATRSWGRIIVGAIVALSAVAGIVSAAGEWTTPWAPIAVAGLIATGSAGVLAMARGSRWPGLGSRYERSTPQVQGADERATWDALDRGEDPTA